MLVLMDATLATELETQCNYGACAHQTCGAGASTALANPDAGLAVAVTVNKMQVTLQAVGPTFEICEFIRGELGVA